MSRANIGPGVMQVLSVSLLQAGKAFNVVPDTARMGGTFRAFSSESFKRLKKRIEEVGALSHY